VSLPTETVLKRGLRRRCPVCGQNKLFRHWVHMAERCPRCGFIFRRIDGHWLGSWFINVCVSQAAVVVVVSVIMTVTYPDVSLPVLAGLGGATALLVPLVFFPWSRTIWSALDLAMRPLHFHEGVDPYWELQADLHRLREEERIGTTELSADRPEASPPD
jgi:uncharacterized protein (DUF983 family)